MQLCSLEVGSSSTSFCWNWRLLKWSLNPGNICPGTLEAPLLHHIVCRIAFLPVVVLVPKEVLCWKFESEEIAEVFDELVEGLTGLRIGSNAMSTNESLPLYYAWHSSIYLRTLILERLFLKLECPFTCLRMLCMWFMYFSY
jgi:hypothetical protein